MPVTGVRGRQILDGDVFRNDLNITTSGSAVTRRIIAGTGVTISSTGVDTGTGDVTINASGGAGTVTSVGLALPNIFTITGSPVTASGTLTGTFANQNANLVFASPNGSAGTPTFRALVAADIPALTLENLPDAWVKSSVRVATTANITLSAPQTIDGIAVVAGDRVLVKDQTTQSQNGIYVVQAAAWTRSLDADSASELAGAIVAVDSGTTNGGRTFDNDFKSTDTLGTTAMTWNRNVDTGSGSALTKTDDTNVTLTLGGSASTSLVNAASLTLGWTGQLSVGRGGTGASTLTGVLIGNGTSAVTAVAGTASQLLRRNAGNTAYEFFTATFLTSAITSLGGLTVATQTFANDTNVTISSSTSTHTLGWTGQLSVGRGGTGASTLTGVLIGNGTSAVTAVAGTASQLLRRNAGNTAYEFFTHDFLSTTGGTLTGTLLFGNATSPNTHTIQFGDNSGWVLRMMTNVSGTPTQRFSFTDGGTFSAVGQIISTRANNTAEGQGQIYLGGINGNRIDWVAAGVAAPSVTTRSVGTKLVLYPGVNATQVDYGFGIDSDTLWASVASTGGNFKWYGATTLNMHLSGQNLVVGIGAGVGSGRLTVNASLLGTSLYLTDATNSTLYITHNTGGSTRFFNGAATQWMQEVGASVTIGPSTSAPSKLFLFNTNDSIPDYQITHQSSGASLNTSSPIIISNLYSNGSLGHNLYVTSSSAAGVWEYNITKTWGGILTLGSSTNGTSLVRQFYLYDSGQLRLANYTTTTSFTGTAVGVLAFTSDGSIITIATPGGGSGLTGSGTTNYISKFTSGTSLGNSLLFDNGTDIGMGTATPTTTSGYTTLHINGASGGLLRFSYAGNNTGTVYGSSAETAINAPSQINFYVANVQIANAQTAQFNTYETFYARKLGAQIQIAGAVGTLSGIFQGGSNLLSIADWATALNGIQLDVGNGILYTRSSLANGGYIAFQRSGTTVYGYVGNSAQLGAAGYNSNTELGIRSEGGINFLTTSGNPLARMQSTGQLRLPLYTTTTSFTGTAVGVLAFTSDGSIITIATPGGGGSSQWTTSGVNIYYTAGGVSIGTTTTSDILHIGKAVGNDTFIRFDQLTRTTWRLGQSATTDPFRLINASAGATRLEVLASGQLILNSYTSASTYNGTDAVGGLYFDTSGNIISGVPPIYRITFVSAGNFTLTNMASALQFYNNQTAYITRADLSGYKRVRLHVMKGGTSGAAASKIILRYATTFSTTTTSYTDIGTTEVSVPINVTNAYQTTSWINLATLAKGDVFIALMQSGGDGSADPVVGNIYAEFDF